MNKTMLTVWLCAPVVMVALLYASIDRGAARKNREEMRARFGARPAAASGLEGLDARAASPGAASQPGAAPAPEGSTMIRPEFLSQGFTLVVKDLAGMANASSPIHLASSWNGWDPGDANQVLTPRSDLRWQIVIPKGRPDTPLAFKFTRGSWDLEELTDDLKPVENRSLPMVDASKLAQDERPVIELEVRKWGDQRPNSAQRPDLDPYYELKTSGNVKRLQVPGGGADSSRWPAGQRDLLVYLPPGYDDPANAQVRYPVLYMQDGQNLFQQLPGVPAEWGADETADALIKAKKMAPVIIVGIPHLGAARAEEYSSFPLVQGAEPRASRYVQWLTGEVMPRVERAFRVSTAPADTGIGGASLGALVAAEAVKTHPDRFGVLLLESMAGLGEQKPALEHFKSVTRWPAKVYFGMGINEAGKDEAARATNLTYTAHAKDFEQMLLSAGASPTGVKFLIDEGVHNEEAWAKRLPEALQFLFPPAGAGSSKP